MQIKTKARFQDCDPLGHLNNSKYLDYFLDARGDWFLKYHRFDMYSTIRTHNAAWITTQNQILYITPIFQHEEISIYSNLIKLTRSSAIMEGIMYNAENKINAILWTHYIFVNMDTNKIIPHPAEIMEMLREILKVNVENNDFSIRVKEISLQSKESIIKV